MKHSRWAPEYLLLDRYFFGDRSFSGLSYWDLFSIRITCLLWDSSCETLSLGTRVAGRQTEQVQTQKRLLASFVFVASPVCVCGQVHRAAPVVDQTNCLESQLLAWLWHKNLCCSHRNLVLNESIISGKPKIRWIKHSFCSYPREGLCKGIWICSYAQYATGSRNRTSSSSTN